MRTLNGDNIYTEVERIVGEAEKSIKIASAWLKGSLVKRLLENVDTEKGIEIEVILRGSELRDLLITDELVFKTIREKGGKIYLNNRLHAKFIVVDGQKAVVGSANFTESGMSEYSKGNIEVAVYYDASDGQEVKELTDYFEKIKEDPGTVIFSDDLIGFALNPVKSNSFEFILLDPEITEQSYVEVRDGERKILGKIESIYSYDMGFFANPFSGSESQVFGSLEQFKLLFSGRKDNSWKKAATYSYLNENGDRVRIAVAQVVGEINGTKLQTPLKPFDVGNGIYRASKETLGNVMKKNFSGKEMGTPVEIGNLEGNRNITVFIDLDEVITKHMAVLGTTGSGKSHFTKLFIKRAVETENPPEVFILDPHGEYKEGLLDLGVDPKLIKEVEIPDTLFPIYPEEVEELIKELGYGQLISGNNKTVRKNRNTIVRWVKPDIGSSGFKTGNLKELLSQIEDEEGNNPLTSDTYVTRTLTGKWEKQEEVIKDLRELLNPNEEEKPLIFILNLKKITDPQTRVNLAGLFMQELFFKNRKETKRRLLILEEAHNFAPEKSYGDVSADKKNLALNTARKIAAEGRKFNLGLVVITQRPAQVSKYVLAQTNTQAMFRIINVNDLQAVETFVEFAGRDITSLLPTLQTGSGVISGLAVPFPVLTEIN